MSSGVGGRSKRPRVGSNAVGGGGGGGGAGSRGSRLPPIPGLGKGEPDKRTVMDSDELLHTLQLFETEPTIRACHRIISSALLASGIVVERGGKPVALRDEFRRHVDTFWTEFARDVITSLLVHGLVPVVIGQTPPPPFGAPKAKGDENNRIPLVASFATVRVAIERDELAHAYKLELLNGDAVTSSHVFVHNPPSATGEANSPMAALKPSLLFVQKLTEYALNCESVRSRQLVTTQVVERASKKDPNLDPQNLCAPPESQPPQSRQLLLRTTAPLRDPACILRSFRSREPRHLKRAGGRERRAALSKPAIVGPQRL